jgi:hypothetical protein
MMRRCVRYRTEIRSSSDHTVPIISMRVNRHEQAQHHGLAPGSARRIVVTQAVACPQPRGDCRPTADRTAGEGAMGNRGWNLGGTGPAVCYRIAREPDEAVSF